MRVLIWIGRGLIALIVLAALAYPLADLLRDPLDDAARAALVREGKAYEFVRLPAGVTHVRVEGPSGGPTVVLIHGLSNSSYAYSAWMAPLTGAGFRVIAPDRFGNGFSDRLDVAYTNDFFIGQIADLLDVLEVKGPVHIVGTSLGGAIVTGVAARETARVKSVTLIAPAGLDGTPSPYNSVFARPVIGDWVFRVLGVAFAESRIAKSFQGAPDPAAMTSRFRDQTRFRGYAESTLNTMRNFDLARQLEDFDGLGRSGLPVLAVWGTADSTVPFKQSEALKRRVPQTQLVALEGKEHNITYADTDAVLAAVIPFLKATEARRPLALPKRQ